MRIIEKKPKILIKKFHTLHKHHLDQPTEHGVLRLKSFTIGELSGLVEYIKKHVDICLREEDKDVVWTHTGVSSKHFTEQLEQELNIK